MNNILDFFDWRLTESKVEIDDIDNDNKSEVKINNKVYNIDNDVVRDENDVVDKKLSKYIINLVDYANDVDNVNNTYELDRMSGDISTLKKGLKDVDIFNTNIYNKSKKSFENLISDIKNVGDSKYVSFEDILNSEDNNKKQLVDVFKIIQKNVGKGEVLLSVLFPDVERHKIDVKGDNKIISDDKNKEYEIEVKSAGATMTVCSPESDGITNMNTPESVCAYSIAKYITGRNIGQIYLIIFDNGVKNVDFNDIKNNKSVENSNETGDTSTNGFFIMNCGKSVKRNSNDCKTKAKEIANKLLAKDKIKLNILNSKSKVKHKFIFYYENGSIVCDVTKEFSEYYDKNKKQ